MCKRIQYIAILSSAQDQEKSVRDAMSKGRIVQGMLCPRDALSKDRIVQWTHCPRAASSMVHIVKGRNIRDF
jgi:hypothetical protein